MPETNTGEQQARAKHKQKGWCSRAGDWSYLLPSMPCLSVLLHLLAFCAGRSSLQGPQAATESFPSLRRQPTHPRTPRPSATGPTCQDPGRQRRDGPCAHRRLGPGPSIRSRTPRAHAQLSGSSSRGSLAGEVVASQFSPRRFFLKKFAGALHCHLRRGKQAECLTKLILHKRSEI